VVNYLINRQLKKKEKVKLFVESDVQLSGQRDNVPNNERERGIREGIIEIIREVQRETKNRVLEER